ncbi:hypothetical protein RRF57_006223 [Xylaria bambusicola]|uniref:Aminoglycoside phosphotransferase domain-containing protein n=1 Tax=Xylaria bambusicola TaxID=326684 RepID=A0AAN7UIZ5_9PEZI
MSYSSNWIIDWSIGSVHKQPLNDITFELKCETVGLFRGIDAVQQYQDAVRLYLASPEPIVFTYNDLVACDILVEKTSVKLAAAVDWAQAGWYPAY